MREKIRRLPVWAVILIALFMMLGFSAVLRLTGMGMALIPGIESWPNYGMNLLAEIMVALYAIALLALTGQLGVFSEKGKGLLDSLYIAGFLVGYCVLELIAQSYLLTMDTEKELLPGSQILMFTLTMFLVGVAEEGVFRGAILNMFLDRFPKTSGGILTAVLLDGFLFGALHINNYFAGVELVPVLIQSAGAAAMGVVFAAIYARSRNLWILIIGHGLVDFAGLMGSGLFGKGTEVDTINSVSTINLVVVLVFAIPAVVLLRPSKLKEMAQAANGIPEGSLTKSRERLAIASLVLGVIGLIAVCFGGYGLGIALTGILAGVLSLKEQHSNQGLAIGGLVVSIVACAAALIMIVIMLAVYGNLGEGGLEELQKMLESMSGRLL